MQLQTYPGIPVYGGSKQGQAVDTIIKDGETFKIGDNIHVKCAPFPFLLPLPLPPACDATGSSTA